LTQNESRFPGARKPRWAKVLWIVGSGAKCVPGGKARIKEIVDEHAHRQGLAPDDLMVEVADRQAPSGARVLSGREVVAARGGFLELRDGASIPYHKVRKMTSRGRVLYERPGAR